jgi:enediyne biosynthesis protein E4
MKRFWLHVTLLPFVLAPVRLLSLFLKENKSEIGFVDIALEAGIRAKVRCGGPEKRWILEANGSGVAWIDYDNEGWLDLLILNG